MNLSDLKAQVEEEIKEENSVVYERFQERGVMLINLFKKTFGITPDQFKIQAEADDLNRLRGDGYLVVEGKRFLYDDFEGTWQYEMQCPHCQEDTWSQPFRDPRRLGELLIAPAIGIEHSIDCIRTAWKDMSMSVPHQTDEPTNEPIPNDPIVHELRAIADEITALGMMHETLKDIHAALSAR